MRVPFVALTLCILGSPVSARQATLTGSVAISPADGTLRANLCLASPSNLPSPLQIVLHHGLNVKWFRAGENGPILDHQGFIDGGWVDEGHPHTVIVPDSLAPLRNACVEYTGAFPVFESNSAALDYKGRIAFMDATIRATEQSKWYPMLYDASTNTLAQDVAYDLTIECEGCRSIYLNGSAVTAGPRANLSSRTPYPLLLFAGNFEVRSLGNLDFINGEGTEARAGVAFETAVHEISEAFENFTDVPYAGRPSFLTFRSMGRNRQLSRTTWGFMTWPTVAFDGAANFDAFVTDGPDGPEIGPLWEGLAHEMAHYYFGTVPVPTGPLRWFLIESMTEYLAFRAIEAVHGKERLARRVASLRRALSQVASVTPLSQVAESEQIDSSYRYVVAPLFLLQLEDRVGTATMRRFVRGLLQSTSSPITYPDIRSAIEAAGIPAGDIDWWERECFARPIAEGCLSQ